MKQPLIIPISKKLYKLVEAYEYEWIGDLDEHHKLVVPEGFIYNGASVPRIAWTISGMRPDGLIRAGALIHDFIYRYAGDMSSKVHFVHTEGQGRWAGSHWLFSRKETDQLFLKIMKQAGMGIWRRSTAYRFARYFAWIVWMKRMRD